MAALLDPNCSEKGEKDTSEILTLLKLGGVEPPVAAEVLRRALTVNIQELPAMHGLAFDLIGIIIRLSKTDQKAMGAAEKSWVTEVEEGTLSPQELRLRR